MPTISYRNLSCLRSIEAKDRSMREKVRSLEECR